MPRKLSRKGKNSRVTAYEKKKKTVVVDENLLLVPAPMASSPLPQHAPVASVSAASPVTVTSSTSGVSSPALVPVATSSPSVHDLTVTYDYSTEEVAPGNHLTTTERFLALFPFTRESPPTHNGTKTRGLWTDLTPTISTAPHSRPLHQHNTSSDFHQLSTIAQNIRETLVEHKSTATDGMTFAPSPDFSGAGNNESHNKSNVSDGGAKDCEEDWFWSQAALLQVDTTTPTGRKATPIPGRKATPIPGKKATPTRLCSRSNKTLAKKMLSTTNCVYKPDTVNGPIAPVTSSTAPLPSQEHSHRPLTAHGPPPSQEHSHRPHTAHGPPPSQEHSHRPRTAHGPPPSQEHSHTAEQDEWGAWGDNDFIDKLLTQGVGMDPPQPRTQGVGMDPPQPSTQGVGMDPPQPRGQQDWGGANLNGPRKVSADQIRAKRDTARRKLSAKLNKK